MAVVWYSGPPEPGLTPLPALPAGTARRLRVLVADGYADAADSLAVLLHLWGYDVRVARTGPDALEAARASRPDVALVDVFLAGLDGYELARRLRDPQVVLIAVTGLGDEQHRRRCREAGFAFTFVKPAPPEELRQILTGLAARINAAACSCRPDGLCLR